MNKRGGSNKACSWEIFLKKNKKNSMLIRDFRVCTITCSTFLDQNSILVFIYSKVLYKEFEHVTFCRTKHVLVCLLKSDRFPIGILRILEHCALW